MWPGPRAGRQGREFGDSGPHSAEYRARRLPLGVCGNPFPLVAEMQSPLVVDALRDQLLRVLDWYQQGPPRFRWGAVIHRRNERGKLRFGAITPQGESLLLSEPMLDELAGMPCWLDGAVRVRLESRRICDPASLARRPGPAEPPTAGRGPGRLLRSRHLARRGHGVPGDGRRADAREVPVGAVRADPAEAGGWPAETAPANTESPERSRRGHTHGHAPFVALRVTRRTRPPR